MSPLLSAAQIADRAGLADQLAGQCRLCPRHCGVRRHDGEKGFCGGGPTAEIALATPHFGEEPPLTGSGGAGTIFFCHCNLRCSYCQNHQISRGSVSKPVSAGTLAQCMTNLEEQGCPNVALVSPSHHLPTILRALALAVEAGLRVPIVYNTNAYETGDTLALLDGIVDIYLPDLKYASSQTARLYSDVPDYVERAREAIAAMHRQTGNLVLDMHGVAVRGTIIRHLVLPNDVSGTAETLLWVRENFPRTVTLSLMAQYSPCHEASGLPELNRSLKAEEYEEALDFAIALGFENVFIQDLESQRVGLPDFTAEHPFEWD